jgi:hypothetical protein
MRSVWCLGLSLHRYLLLRSGHFALHSMLCPCIAALGQGRVKRVSRLQVRNFAIKSVHTLKVALDGKGLAAVVTQ